MRLQKLTQKASASSYAAEFRNSALYLNWGEEAYIAAYYRGLKSEVKDAMVGRKPTTFNTLVTLSVEIDDQQERRATISEEHQEKDDLRRRFYTRDEGTPWVHPGREVRLARKLELPVADQDIIAPVEEYPETEDKQNSGPSNKGHWIYNSLGNRMWTKLIEIYNNLANERQEPTEDKPIYIRAYDIQLGRNPHHMIPKEREDNNPRIAVTHPNHEEISWASCVVHTCQTHKKDKIY
ncbi:gag polyprotein [Ilyonectria robusta]